jgi:predicted small integral membrane protein
MTEVAMLDWMAWTWQTALFFGFVAFMLTVLTLLAVYRPETPRVGILRFPTTRGDRFFVTMIGSAYIFIFWTRFGGGSLWYPLGAAVLYGIAMFTFA